MHNFEKFIPEWLKKSKLFLAAIIDINGYYAYANELLLKNLEENTTLIGKFALDTMHPDDRDKVDTLAQTCFLPPYNSVEIVIRKNYKFSQKNEYTLTEWEFSPLFDDNQQPIGLLAIGKDRSQLKKYEEELLISQHKLRALIDSTNDSHILLSPTYEVLSFNKTAAENVKIFFQADLKEGQDFLKYIVEGEEGGFKNYCRRALSGEIIKEEFEVKISENQSIWYWISFYPVYDEAGQIVAVSYNASDIDKLKKAELKLKQQNKQLQEIAHLQSHEIRRPVANILGLINILETETLTAKNQVIFDNLLKASQELDQIIHQIVDKTQEV
jgi:PAS domain S-box-containing protein